MTSEEIRNKEIWALRAQGETLKTIGQTYGLSLERIRQICEIPARLERKAKLEASKKL